MNINKRSFTSLILFIVLLNIITFAQGFMFYGASSFNQDVSSWDVSSGTNFVSGL